MTLPPGLGPGGSGRQGRAWVEACPVLPPAIAAAIASAGCDAGPSAGSAPADGAAVTVRDSAGIEIVENHAPENPPEQFWTLDPEPEFVLGGTDGPAARSPAADRDDRDGRILYVRGLARLVDGRIAVLSEGNHRLFVFESSGRLSKAIGGRGAGPGEFSRPVRMQYLPPDTLAVWDQWMGPVTYFDTAGVVLKRRPIDLGKVLAAVPWASHESPVIPLPDGSFVAAVPRGDAEFAPPRQGALVRHPPVEYVRVDVETYVARSLGIWDGAEKWAVPRDVLAAHPVLRERIDRHGLAGTDEVMASHLEAGGRGGAIYVANGERNEIRQFSFDGSLVRIIRRTTSPVAVTERADRSWRNHLLELAGPQGRELGVEAWPGREHHPAVAGMSVDAVGHLWVREWSESESGMPDQWSVFGPEGRWLGVLRMSGVPWLCRHGTCWIDRDWLVVLRLDALGVERIEGYRIRRDGRER